MIAGEGLWAAAWRSRKKSLTKNRTFDVAREPLRKGPPGVLFGAVLLWFQLFVVVLVWVS